MQLTGEEHCIGHVTKPRRLPERIRPTVCAFGGLADSFLPFPLPNGQGTIEMGLASVVMKATQARLASGTGMMSNGGSLNERMESAGKLGDDASMSKAQARAA